MAGVSREVLKWLQSLDLTYPLKRPKWDMANGFLVGEIFSWYFPHEVEMHMFSTGNSFDAKKLNWRALKIFFKRNRMDIPKEYIEGTMHTKEGAAVLLIERIYEILTNRRIRPVPTEHEIDFTDRAYQTTLPFHARSTASQAVKNNIKITEVLEDPMFSHNQRRAVHIINEHVEHRRIDRLEDPLRFEKKPTIGELAIRQAPHAAPISSDTSMVM